MRTRRRVLLTSSVVALALSLVARVITLGSGQRSLGAIFGFVAIALFTVAVFVALSFLWSSTLSARERDYGGGEEDSVVFTAQVEFDPPGAFPARPLFPSYYTVIGSDKGLVVRTSGRKIANAPWSEIESVKSGETFTTILLPGVVVSLTGGRQLKLAPGGRGGLAIVPTIDSAVTGDLARRLELLRTR
jgi:uncharacterized protein (DUF58 family)